MTAARSSRAGSRSSTPSTPAQVLDALGRVATEPDRYAEFLRDPAAALQRLGLDEASRTALASGDAASVHAAISGPPETNEALETSRANAKAVTDILAADPAVAQWLQAFYLQSYEMWRTGAAEPWSQYRQWLGGSPTPPPPAEAAAEAAGGGDG
jgi:hypothetical protein